jgi:hypothetical protein
MAVFWGECNFCLNCPAFTQSMNTMTPSENKIKTGTGTPISPESIAFLEAGAKWARFIAIMGFIACTILMVAGCIAFVKGLGERKFQASILGFGYGIGYFLGAILAYFPSNYLHSFARQAIKVGDTGSAYQVQDCLENLSKYFRFSGILIILALAGFGLLVLMTTATFA